MAPAPPTGTIEINQPAPYHYGDILTFTTDSQGLHGAHPMVEVALYQDVNGNGTVDENLYSTDLVFLTLNTPEQPVVLATGEGTHVDASKPSKGQARLLAYGWKGRQEYVTPLDSIEFDVS